MSKYIIPDDIKANILVDGDLGYTLVAFYEMAFDVKNGWLGKWSRQDNSFNRVTESEKEAIVAFCEWFTKEYAQGYDNALLEYIKKEQHKELPIDDKSFAVVRFLGNNNGYSTRIQLYRKLAFHKKSSKHRHK